MDCRVIASRAAFLTSVVIFMIKVCSHLLDPFPPLALHICLATQVVCVWMHGKVLFRQSRWTHVCNRLKWVTASILQVFSSSLALMTKLYIKQQRTFNCMVCSSIHQNFQCRVGWEYMYIAAKSLSEFAYGDLVALNYSSMCPLITALFCFLESGSVMDELASFPGVPRMPE